ncbi:MAG: ORC1-type DNA replication protein [Promethearchaeota archaeon]
MLEESKDTFTGVRESRGGSVTEIIRHELQRPSVFIDEAKLSIDYVPPNLPHREEHLRKLTQLFRGVIEAPGRFSQKVLIVGDTGSGKTSVTKLFGKLLTEIAKSHGFNLVYVHVNARRERTEYMILNKILAALQTGIPLRGLSTQELLSIVLEFIETHNLYLLITLDELGVFLKRRGEELLYLLSRTVDDQLNAQQRISLIGISRNPLFGYILDPSTWSTLQKNMIQFNRYNSLQLRDILNFRIKAAVLDGAVPPSTIDLIADIAGASGDARYALELLYNAGKVADEKGVIRILPEYVRSAKAFITPEIRREVLLDLSFHQKLLLLAVCRLLKPSEDAYVTTGALEARYGLVSEEYNQTPRSHTQVWAYIQELVGLGILTSKISGIGQRGKTTLIGLPDIPAAVLENELELQIEKRKVGG